MQRELAGGPYAKGMWGTYVVASADFCSSSGDEEEDEEVWLSLSSTGVYRGSRRQFLYATRSDSNITSDGGDGDGDESGNSFTWSSALSGRSGGQSEESAVKSSAQPPTPLKRLEKRTTAQYSAQLAELRACAEEQKVEPALNPDGSQGASFPLRQICVMLLAVSITRPPS